MILTIAQMCAICPTLPPQRAPQVLGSLVPVFSEFQIDTPLRVSAFLAQIAHETAEFKYMRELWGPTAQQLKYEPPSELATKLGNKEPGDGYRYRGRGAIQITGRANYRDAGQALGIDLIARPDLAANLDTGLRIAGWFWKSRGLNQLADKELFRGITRKINGGYNGMVSRIKYYNRAKKTFGVNALQEENA